MKKILSLILAAMMILSCAAFVAADEAEEAVAAEETVSAEDYYLEFLVYKNIWKGVSAEELIADAESNVERWQMALLVSRISTGWLDDEQWEDDVANDSTFTDLAGTVAENYLGAISYANQNGIIEGYTAEKFAPLDNITYRDGLTMAVRTLGYKGLQYPWGYIEKAVELGLTADIDKAYTADLTRGEVATILYHALFADTKAGETLAKSIFDVEFGWENIVIVGGRKGYFAEHSTADDKCPAGYVAFKILADDAAATLSSATYYVKAEELGLTALNAKKALGATYLALFEIADNGIVNMIDAFDLTLGEYYNMGPNKLAKIELKKYTLVNKYYETPFISEANGDELMLYAMGSATKYVIDQKNVAVDVETLNILVKDSKGNWDVAWWYDQVNDRYYKVIWDDEAGKIAVDYLDQTLFDEWYADAIKVSKKKVLEYGLVTSVSDAMLDDPYTKLTTYDVDGDGVADRALYKTYKLYNISVANDPGLGVVWAWIAEIDAASANKEDGVFGAQTELYNWLYEDAEWGYNTNYPTYEFDKTWTVSFSEFCPEEYVDYTDLMDSSYMVLANIDRNGKHLDVLKVVEDDGLTEQTADEDFKIINGMLKGYSMTSTGTNAKINIDGEIYNLGYAGLGGTVFGSFTYTWVHPDMSWVTEPRVTDTGIALAQWLNDHLWEELRFIIVDGKVVDIDMYEGYEDKDEQIFVLGYAGITAEDNLIAVYGYSTFDMFDEFNKADGAPAVEIYKIASINGWRKGDYKYYPLNALDDELFATGSIYTVNAYDKDLDAYHVEATTAAELATTPHGFITSMTFERGYRIIDNSADGVQKMSENDKYIFVNMDGTISAYCGIVEHETWSIENAPIYILSARYNDKDEMTDCLYVFYVTEDTEIEGFTANAFQTELVLFDKNSAALDYTSVGDITNDYFLGKGDYLMGSVQLKNIRVFNLMSGSYSFVAAANNIDFEEGQVYVVVGGTIIGKYLGTNLNAAPSEYTDIDELLEGIKDLYWNNGDDAIEGSFSYNNGGRYIVFDKLNGAEYTTDDLIGPGYSLYDANCGALLKEYYGYKSDAIMGSLTHGSVAGIYHITETANGFDVADWTRTFTDHWGLGTAYGVVGVYDTAVNGWVWICYDIQ